MNSLKLSRFVPENDNVTVKSQDQYWKSTVSEHTQDTFDKWVTQREKPPSSLSRFVPVNDNVSVDEKSKISIESQHMYSTNSQKKCTAW